MIGRAFAPLLVLLLLSTGTLARADTFDYRLEARKVAEDVYVFVGLSEDFSFDNGGNIVNTGFIVGPEGIIVIDTGPSRRYGEQMLAAIRRLSPLPVVLTINTHHHPDHFLGNQAFPRESLAALPTTIRGIEAEGEAFNDNMYRLNGDWMRATEVVIPSRRLAAGRRQAGGRDIELLALGGHDAADLVVLDLASGTVFAGDLLFRRRAPTTPHADIPRWLAALDALARLPAKRWIPGHGEIGDGDGSDNGAAAIDETRAYLTWLADTVREGAEGGLDMTELFATPIPADFLDLVLVQTEFRRSVAHLFPAAEQAALQDHRTAAGPARNGE